MKKTFFVTAILFAGISLIAQDGPLKKRDLKFNAGIGLGSYIKVAGGKTTFLPVTISGEYAINENTTAGPVIGYTATEDRYYYSSINSTTIFKLSNLLIGGNVKYYFDISNPKLEAYAGGFLGYNAVSSSVESKSTSSTSYYGVTNDVYTGDVGGIIYGVEVGGRYKFSPNLAAFAELSYGIAILNVGITFSLNKK